MRANVGDRIVIKGHRAGQPDRDCEVIGLFGFHGGLTTPSSDQLGLPA
jgi:hypothetical protein